jgi:alanyl-tRNA synthetase
MIMNTNDIRQKYLDFFKERGHKIIPSASLVPRETDASVLFTTAGMHPLVPYLLGEKHPGGKRVVNVQKCIRTGDIDDVGDNRHLTFFEMMGNWSFGDYFKKEAIEWSFEFLTGKEWLNLDPQRIYVTVFMGEDGIPRDLEAIEIWKKVFREKAGMEVEVAGEDEIIKDNVRIIPLGINDNFWIAGATGPSGGDTEMFFDTRPDDGKIFGQKFSDLVDSFRLIEIWNDVFMEFNKTANGQYEKLKNPNVDTGMGVERTLAILNSKETVFETELFQPIFEKISEISGRRCAENDETKKSFHIISDHLKAAVFIIADGVEPSNVGRGYVLRRLIRRAVRQGNLLGIEKNFTAQIAEVVVEMYKDFYKELEERKNVVLTELEKEEGKFRQTLNKGLVIFNNWFAPELTEEGENFWSSNKIVAKRMFDLYQTHGFPIEIIFEELTNRNIKFDKNKYLKLFQEELKKHQELSRTASAGAFKGGLRSQDEQTTKLHTATHLLQAALRQVLGEHIFQKGSNITPERLRFDFSHPEKMTPEQIQAVENLVNEKIKENLSVKMEEMSVEEAKAAGALGVFESKYGEKVKVYSTDDALGKEKVFSKEICGGPHAANTGELGHFKIVKEEASSAGVRRIKAILE